MQCKRGVQISLLLLLRVFLSTGFFSVSPVEPVSAVSLHGWAVCLRCCRSAMSTALWVSWRHSLTIPSYWNSSNRVDRKNWQIWLNDGPADHNRNTIRSCSGNGTSPFPSTGKSTELQKTKQIFDLHLGAIKHEGCEELPVGVDAIRALSRSLIF